MFFTPLRVLTVLYVFTAVRASALLGNPRAVEPSPDIVRIAPMGNVAAVQITTGDTRIFYQDSTGAIDIGGITAPLLSGGTAKANTPFIPASEIRIYFLSPENVLSEYIWTPSGGFTGGPSCTRCLTAQGIVVQNGSQVLYAMANTAFNQFRVGFVSAGQPTTISEAENLGGGWGGCSIHLKA
ncbi:hypothetical protein B0H14DRAFT_3859080 [Mycena olivaceomarginata]|nr:hypothetical protein B0H14DRAFT_3859080 [Mycena olivaceomarginata]